MLCDKDKLVDVVEGILFVSGNGVDLKDIAEKLEVEKKDVEKAVEELKTRLEGTGINLITYRGNAQLCSNPDFADDIATVLNPIREKLLTKATMETLAIVAYKQPVTRLEIEQIRGGASSDYAMQILINFKLVEVVGRKDAIGKPLLFGTTDEFLKRFNLNSLEDLPDYDELLERIQVLKQEASDSLYRSTEIIPDEELPDSKEHAEAEENAHEKDKKHKDNSAKKDDNIFSEKTEKTDENIEKSVEKIDKNFDQNTKKLVEKEDNSAEENADNLAEKANENVSEISGNELKTSENSNKNGQPIENKNAPNENTKNAQATGGIDTPINLSEEEINLSEEETMKTLQSAYEQDEDCLSQKDQDLL